MPRALCLAWIAAVSAWLPPIRVPRRAGPRAASRALEPPAADADAQLKAGIAGFYDGLSPLWEEVWGEHLHHGYYDAGARAGALTLDEHRAAQVRMVDEVLDWAGASASARPREVLDVGCGVGGSSRRHRGDPRETESTGHLKIQSSFGFFTADPFSFSSALDVMLDMSMADHAYA